MSNISLANPGTSINFDGVVIQNEDEAEYRKEEEQQQHELRQLLTNAFDDLLDDDILSVTSDDSINVSGSQDPSENGRTPRRKRASGHYAAKAAQGTVDYHEPTNERGHQISHDTQYVQSHVQTANFGGTYNLDTAPSRDYNVANYAHSFNPSQNHKGQTYLKWGGSVENLDLQRGHFEVNEHPHEEFIQEYPYPEHHPKSGPVENRLILGVERGETEGGNDHLKSKTNQYWGHNFANQHRDLYTDGSAAGAGNSNQFQETNTFGHVHRNLGNEININFPEGLGFPGRGYDIHAERNELGNATETVQFSLPSDSRRYDLNYDEAYSSLPSHNNEGMIRHVASRQDTGPPSPRKYEYTESYNGPQKSPRKQDFPESYKVHYKGAQSDIPPANRSVEENGSSNQEMEQAEFLQQVGGEEGRQLSQLQVLYKARGRQLEDLTRDYESLKDESARQQRILKHQLSIAQGDKEGVETSYQQCQNLLQDTKDENAQLLGKLQALEAQLEGLKTAKNELVSKLQTAETTVENLTQELTHLQHTDTLARARTQHESVVSSMQQKFDKEILALKEQLDIASETVNQKNMEMTSLRQQLTEATRASEQAQISRAETINRLTRSLDESQKRCQSILESTSTQEVSELRMSLKQTAASKKMTEEMCDTLQCEMKELKEQLSMIESASSLGVFTSTKTHTRLADDSLSDLGIKKTLDFSTPGSSKYQPRFEGSQASADLITSLKAELERCLASNRQKRSQVTKLQEEVKDFKKEIKALKEDNSRLEKMTEEQKVKLQDVDDLLAPGRTTSAVESRLRKEIENIKREKTAILEDNEELKKRLEELAGSEERLAEINQELTNQISDMVRDYDNDKREALDRLQRTCDQVHEDARSLLRQELETKYSVERAQLVTKYETELASLRSEVSGVQQELDDVKEMYVKVCEEKAELEDTVKKQLEEEKNTELKIVQDELEKEKVEEIETLREQLNIDKESIRAEVREEVKVTHDTELKQKLEEELAKVHVEWLAQHDSHNIREEVRKAVEKEMELKHKGAIDDLVQAKVEEAKITWMAERKILFESELQQRVQSEKVLWQQAANQRLEEAVNTAIDKAKEQWLLKDDKPDMQMLLEAEKAQWKKQSENSLEKAIAQAVADAKTSWELTSARDQQTAIDREVKLRLKSEKTKWQVESDGVHEVDVRQAVEEAEQTANVRLAELREELETEFVHKLQSEKQKWQLEADRNLQLELTRAVTKRQNPSSGEKSLIEQELVKRLKVEKEKWTKDYEARVLAEVEKAVEAAEAEFRRQEEDDRLKMKEIMEAEIGVRLKQEMNKTLENAKIEKDSNASQNPSSRVGQSAAEVTRSILEQEIEVLKLEKNRVVSELKSKESTWLQEKMSLIGQKDAERRDAVQEMEEQCERDYKKFMEEQKEMLTETLRSNRQLQEEMKQEKARLQQYYEEEIRRLQNRDKQLDDSRNLSTSIGDDLDGSILDQERQLWQEESEKLKKSIRNRDVLLKRADKHMSKEMERLRDELEQAYQQQLEEEVEGLQERFEAELGTRASTGIVEKLDNFESEKSSYLQKIQTLEDELAEKSKQLLILQQEQDMRDQYKQEVDRLLLEKQNVEEKLAEQVSALNEKVQESEKLSFRVRKLEAAYRSDMKSQKEKFEEMNLQLKKSDEARKKCVLEVEELNRALSESEAAMTNLTQKMVERQKAAAMTMESLKKQHKLEKKELLKQLRMYLDKNVTNAMVQTDESGSLLMDLRSQYLETVDKIRDDVMQHITQTNLRAADTVRSGITQEKQITVFQLKKFYKNSVRKILQNELMGAELEAKLAVIDRALESLSDSITSSRSNTPDQEVKASEVSQVKGQSSSSSFSLGGSGVSNLTPRSVSSGTSNDSFMLNYQVKLHRGNNNAEETDDRSQESSSRVQSGVRQMGSKVDFKQQSMVTKTGKDMFPRPVPNLSLRLLETPSPVESNPSSADSSPRAAQAEHKVFRPVDPPQRASSASSRMQTVTFSHHTSMNIDSDGFKLPRDPAPKKSSAEPASKRASSNTSFGGLTENRSRSPPGGSAAKAHRSRSAGQVRTVESRNGPNEDVQDQQIRSASRKPPQLSLLRRSFENDFSSPKKMESFAYHGMSKAQSEKALNTLADIEGDMENKTRLTPGGGRSPGSVQVSYKYTPLRQSLHDGSPSTSLFSNHSLSEGDLRIADEEPVLNFQSLGLGNPSPRKFNPAPDKLETRCKGEKSSKNLDGRTFAQSLENLSISGLQEVTVEGEEFWPLEPVKSDSESTVDSFRAFPRALQFPQHSKTEQPKTSSLLSGKRSTTKDVSSNIAADRQSRPRNSAHSYREFHKGRQLALNKQSDSSANP